MTQWVYKRTEPGLWTVGFYTPEGEWEAESDLDNKTEAAQRVHWLNGGDLIQTKSGLVLTPERLEELADEAERGYDVDQILANQDRIREKTRDVTGVDEEIDKIRGERNE